MYENKIKSYSHFYCYFLLPVIEGEVRDSAGTADRESDGPVSLERAPAIFSPWKKHFFYFFIRTNILFGSEIHRVDASHDSEEKSP